MSEESGALVARAKAWIAGDPDPATRAELQEFVDSGDTEALRNRFEPPLGFGTAGLRGVVGAGPARMNRAVVIRTTHALAEYLIARELDARTLPVVVGFDARHSSRELAEATIGVLAAARIPVRYFPNAVPTPLVAYALRQLAGVAGIVITASHNPADYNGYKLYASNWIQVIPPADVEIERRIAEAPPANEVPLDADAVRGVGSFVEPIPESIIERYVAEVVANVARGPASRDLRIVYTPLHGVGGKLARAALRSAGFSDVVVVPEQAEPNGDFPTAPFPNPEDPKVLELAHRLAADEHADLVLANDPDADRLAVSVPTPARRFLPLSGNQIGILLADFVLERAGTDPRPLLVSSIVSTPMLSELAKARGARHEQTLTGFKWIWNAALHLEHAEGVRFVFGYEEAIGFSFMRSVRDKDGIGAALLFAELAANCRASGESVRERLLSLYERYGLWASAQRSVVRSESGAAAEIGRAVDRLASAPPNELGGRAVTGTIDYRIGADSRPFWLGASPLVALELEKGGRVLVRPSGTEPKLKIYVDLRDDLVSGADGWKVEGALREAAKATAEEVVRFLGF
jgi:phosphomannomutase